MAPRPSSNHESAPFHTDRSPQFPRRPVGGGREPCSLQLLAGQLLSLPPLQLLLEEQQVDVDDVIQHRGGAEESSMQRPRYPAAKHVLAWRHTHTCTHIHAHTYMHTHTCTHTHTHTHTHTACDTYIWNLTLVAI